MGNGQTFKPATGTDIDILARTLYGEARGEFLAGKVQVAFTILKRAAIAAAWIARHGAPHPHYGDGTIMGACKADRQYSCWNVGDPNYATINKVSLDDPAFQECMHVATGVVHGTFENKFPEATHYLNPQAVSHIPAWVTGVPAAKGRAAIPAAKFEGTIGHHRFYSAVPA